ncbi:MAG: hypothetical protein PHU46_09035 [Rhodocyclaceae bacterium]|nr:hypothetical protein [Rhodocyclaceae bacterium]
MTETNLSPESCTAKASRFNRDCHCVSLDRNALRSALACEAGCGEIWHLIETERPLLFADTAMYVGRRQMTHMAQAIAAMERVIALPVYRDHVLSRAPAIAQMEIRSAGVFMGYDFHLGADGPKLIEINTNAGGAMLVASLGRAHRVCCHDAPPLRNEASAEDDILEMFREEWRLERADAPLHTVAIVDDAPEEQFLYPEFLLFARLFQRAGIEAIVCAPSELVLENGALWHGKRRVDLVYNRVTDFSLEHHESLRRAYETNAAVLTPHPRAHALYADKRNLIALSDPALLTSFGVDAETRKILLETIPRTEAVTSERAEDFWARRKQLFFKPAGGFGSKAAYRGDKLTKRVFAEILGGGYVAQALAPPGERRIGQEPGAELKVDLRHYVYQGRIQQSCARLYQGQTTNFRTPGGGFAPVVIVDRG